MNTEYAVGNIRIHFESRARRRFFVALCYAVFAVADLTWCFLNPKINPNAKPQDTASAWIVAGCMILSVLFVIVFTGIAGDMHAGDERETHRREHAFFKAYFILGNFLICALFAGYFRGPNPITLLLPPVLREVLGQLTPMLLGAAGVLYITLPQAILLWTEPDMDENPKATG